MNYEINVSLNGTHFFATAERSINSMESLKRVHRELSQRFLESEGFRIMVYETRRTSRVMSQAEVYDHRKGDV